MPESRTAVERLREATGAAHQELDGMLGIVSRLAAPGGPAAMLPRYFALHAIAEPPIEAALAHLSATARAALQPQTRQRVPAIAGALRRLGLPTPKLPDHRLALSSTAAALGALYVLEGSSLGGRLILRDLHAAGADTAGLEFLDPYGDSTGARWRALLAVLETELRGESDRTYACDAALATFTLARACLHQTTAVMSHAA
jgi:heme oxygenase